MNELKRLAEGQKPYLSAVRRDLHRHPELALQEFRTAGVIEAELDRIGVEHRRVGATGVLGVIRGGQPGGQVIALRADIDALPIQEQNEVDYRSEEDGKMHACGHDSHTAMLLGAAELLAARRGQWGGEVRLIFQPAEETGKGVDDFLQAGVMDGVGRVLGLHVAPDLPLGTVGVKPGLNNAAVDEFRITVQGKSVHVSTPELGVDALYIASHIVVGLQAQVSRRTSPVEPVVLGVGTFRSGTTYNALAETAVLEGTTRTLSAESRARAREQVESTAKSIAAIYGGAAQVTWYDTTSALVNDPGAAAELKELLEAERGDLTVKTDRAVLLSGDNFAEYLLHAPGVYVQLGTANPEKPATLRSIHNGGFDLDEDAMPIGAWLYTAYAEWWLKQKEAQ